MSSTNSSREGSPQSGPRYGRFKNAVLSVIKTFPQDEAAWTEQGPQTEADINALFWSLTMNHIPHQARKLMPCRFLLESFAQTMTEPQCPLHALTLAAACSVALSDGQLTFHEAAEILANVFPRPGTDLKVQRAAVARHLRFLDLVRQVTGSTRVYEIPLRSKGCLDKFNSFNHRHLELLEEMLRTGEAKVYKPRAKLDSTMLRIQNVVFHLFGGRFNRHRVEMHLLKRDVEGLPSDTRPVMPSKPEPILTKAPSPSFYKLLPLNKESEELRRLACSDVVGLAATFRRDPHPAALYPMGPWPQLCGFVQAQEKSIRTMLAGARKRVVDIKGHEGLPPRVIRVNHTIGFLVPDNFIGFCVLLRDTPVSMKFGETVVLWEPGQIMCFRGEPPEFMHEERQFFFLMSFLEVESF